MGIRFVELAGDSRALVDKIVRQRVAAGLELFDLEGNASASRAATADRPVVTAPPDSEGRPIWELDPRAAAPATVAAGESLVVDEPVGEFPDQENLASLDPEVTGPTRLEDRR